MLKNNPVTRYCKIINIVQISTHPVLQIEFRYTRQSEVTILRA